MNRKKWAALLSGGFCVVMLVWCVCEFQNSIEKEVSIDPSHYYPVSRVVDGDTFKVTMDDGKSAGHEITVRLLGINTPETVDPRKSVQCFGHEASDEAKALLAGRSVRLEFNPDRERRDKYGRYLLYVYRDDGLFVNEFLVREGFAREYTVGKPYSLQASFRKAQNEAEAAQKGLWAACAARTTRKN